MKKMVVVLSVLALVLLTSQTARAAGSVSTRSNPGSVVVKNDHGTLYLTTEASSASTAETSYATISARQGDLAMPTVILPEGFFTDFSNLFNRLLTLVIAISALLVFLYLIWGGIDWITSGGDKGKTEQARQKIVSAVIGLIIVAASYAILTLALNFLGYTSLNDVFNDTRTPVIIQPVVTATPSATPVVVEH